MQASIFLMGIPLFYAFFVYAAMNQLGALGNVFFMTIVIAGLVAAILAAINVLGSGLNAMGTFIAFTIVVASSFYGLSVSNYGLTLAGAITRSQSLDTFPFKVWIDVIFGIMYALGTFFLVTARSGE